jgi:hypothetical protein
MVAITKESANPFPINVNSPKELERTFDDSSQARVTRFFGYRRPVAGLVNQLEESQKFYRLDQLMTALEKRWR